MGAILRGCNPTVTDKTLLWNFYFSFKYLLNDQLYIYHLDGCVPCCCSVVGELSTLRPATHSPPVRKDSRSSTTSAVDGCPQPLPILPTFSLITETLWRTMMIYHTFIFSIKLWWWLELFSALAVSSSCWLGHSMLPLRSPCLSRWCIILWSSWCLYWYAVSLKQTIKYLRQWCWV